MVRRSRPWSFVAALDGGGPWMLLSRPRAGSLFVLPGRIVAIWDRSIVVESSAEQREVVALIQRASTCVLGGDVTDPPRTLALQFSPTEYTHLYSP